MPIIPELAATDSATVAARGSGRWLRLKAVDLSNGSELDSDLRTGPRRGREFFEEITRDNLDRERRDRALRVVTPDQCRTRATQDGVLPSHRINYKVRHDSMISLMLAMSLGPGAAGTTFVPTTV